MREVTAKTDLGASTRPDCDLAFSLRPPNRSVAGAPSEGGRKEGTEGRRRGEKRRKRKKEGEEKDEREREREGHTARKTQGIKEEKFLPAGDHRPHQELVESKETVEPDHFSNTLGTQGEEREMHVAFRCLPI